MNQQNHSSGIEVADWGRNAMERIKQSWCEFDTAYMFFSSSKTLLIGWKICWNRSPFDNQRTKGRKEIEIDQHQHHRGKEDQKQSKACVRESDREERRFKYVALATRRSQSVVCMCPLSSSSFYLSDCFAFLFRRK